MKSTIILLSLVFIFPCLSYAQKNEISIDGRYIPVETYLVGGSINYFRYINTNNAIGAKLNINTLVSDSDYVIDYYHKTKERYEVNFPSLFSVVYKHIFFNKNRSTISSDIGLATYAEIIHHLKERRQWICGVGYPDNYKEPKREFKEWEINYYFAITASISYTYRLINNIAIGIDLQALAIGGTSKAEIYPVMIPSLRLSYKY